MRIVRSRRLAVFAAAASVGVLLTSCSSSSAESATPSASISASSSPTPTTASLAIASPSVEASAPSLAGQSITLYSGQHEQTTSALVTDFTKRTGITVKVKSDDEASLVGQLLQEGSASPADAFFAENPPALTTLQDAGLLAAVDPSTPEQVPAAASSAADDWVGVSARSVALAVNSSIAGSALPASVLDLSGPAWKGKLGVAPSETDFSPVVTAIIKAEGQDAAKAWLDGLKANSKVYEDNEALIAAIDSGEVEAGIVDHYYWYRLRDEVGATKVNSSLHYFAAGDPGALVDVSGAGVLKSSSHQAAAQAFLAYLVSAPAQTIIATSNSYEYPLRPGISSRAKLPRPRPDRPPGRPRRRQAGPDPPPGRGAALISVTSISGRSTRRLPVSRRALSPLGGVTAGVVALVALPLVFVVVQAVHAGWAPARALLHRPIVPVLLWHTAALAAAVTTTTAVIGFGAAYLVERTDIPLRRFFSVALVMPLAVPEFVQGFSWVSLTSWVRGYGGAVLVMTCALYPLVYLPVAAGLRRADPRAEEGSRSVGVGKWGTLMRVTLPSSRSALGGGALLVCLYLLGEYGAFAALRFQTFAPAIFTQYKVAYDTGAGPV